jgi:segregation and condensation protein A
LDAVAGFGFGGGALAVAAVRCSPELRREVTDVVDTETSGVEKISAWEDPPRGAPADAAPILSADGFEGPLDWLLEMARAKKIDLARLSIAALIDSFAAALDAALAQRLGHGAELGRWGTWLVMAANLAWMRSRLLLPADAPEATAAEAEAEALRRDLVERARMRAAVDWLERRPQLGREVFRRGAPEMQTAGRVGDLTELLRACLVALRVPEAQDVALRPRPPPFWSATDAITRLRQFLPTLPESSSLWSVLPTIAADATQRDLRCRAAVASTLLAGLELARTGDLTLEQDEPWTQIHVQQPAAAEAGADQAA